MPYKSTPFDYEPVTRRGQKALEERELDEEFTAPRRRLRQTPPLSDANLSDANGEPLLLLPRPGLHEEKLKSSPSSEKIPDLLGSGGRAAAKKEGWISERGHALSFAGLFLFTLVLYFRPYELFESLSSFKSLAFWIAITTVAVFIPTQLSLEGTLTSLPREVTLILLLALIALVGTPLSSNPSEAWENVIQFLKVVLMFIVMVNVTRTERRLKALIFLGLAAGCMVSVAALNDYRLGQLKIMGERVQGIVGGMLDNPNDIALYLVTMIPLAVGLLLSKRGVTRKLVYGACALVMIAANLITFSRGGFFGLVCVLLVLAWKIGRQHRLRAVLCSVLLGGLMLILLPGGLVERLATLFGSGGNEGAAASAVSRWSLLLRSLLVSARHPLLGIGMGTFHTVSIHEQVSHNAYTQVSSELGIPALIIYVMLMVTALRRLRQIERETLAVPHNARFYYLAIGLQASLIGYMVSSFFASVAFLYYVYYPIGFALCLHLMYKSSQAKREAAGVKARRIEEEAGAGFSTHALLETGNG